MSEPMDRARRVVAVGAATLVVVLVALAAAAWRLVEAEEASAAGRGRVAAADAARDLAAALFKRQDEQDRSLLLVRPDGTLLDPPPPHGFDPMPPSMDPVGAFYVREAPALGGSVGRRALRTALCSTDGPTRVMAAAEGIRMELREGTGREADWWHCEEPPGLSGTRDFLLVEMVIPPAVDDFGASGLSRADLHSKEAIAAVGTPDEAVAEAIVARFHPEELHNIRYRRRQRAESQSLITAFLGASELDGGRRLLMSTDGSVVVARRVSLDWAVDRLAPDVVREIAATTLAPRGARLARVEPATVFGAVEAPGAGGWSVVPTFAEAEARSRSTLLYVGLGVAGLAAAGAFLAFARSVRREARLATLRTEFVATVSHELRTPVAVVRTSAETLASGRATRDEDKQALTEAIVRESERLSTLLGNVLDFARMESGRRAYAFRDVDVGALVRDVATRHAGVDVDVAADVPRLRCDADALGAAVGNLLDNARKYGPGARCALRVSTTAGDVVIEVVDHGIGVPDAEKPHVFERFFRGTDPRVRETRGAGIGLALVQHAAQAHGGRVEVVDTPGGGATFRIVLPMTQNGDA